MVNTEELWVQVLRNKYTMHGILLDSIHRSKCSYIWCLITNIWDEDEVKKWIFWIVEDGKLVNFWNDCWLSDMGPLRQYHFGQGTPLDSLLCDVLTGQV